MNSPSASRRARRACPSWPSASPVQTPPLPRAPPRSTTTRPPRGPSTAHRRQGATRLAESPHPSSSPRPWPRRTGRRAPRLCPSPSPSGGGPWARRTGWRAPPSPRSCAPTHRRTRRPAAPPCCAALPSVAASPHARLVRALLSSTRTLLGCAGRTSHAARCDSWAPLELGAATAGRRTLNASDIPLHLAALWRHSTPGGTLHLTVTRR